MSECLPYCLGGELLGFMEWMMWYVGCAAAIAVGQLGLLQAAGSEPMTRAPFVLMVATGIISLFAVDGSLALLSFVIANGSSVSLWLAAACGIDDLLDRCTTFERSPTLARQLIHLALCGATLLQVCLNSNSHSESGHVAMLVMYFLTGLGMALVAFAFRHVTKAQLDLTEPAPAERDNDNDNVSVSAVDAVRRCMDLGLAASATNLAMTIAAVAIEISHSRGDHCRDFNAVVVLQVVAGFVAAFYMIMSVVALRTAAGRPPLTCTYTLWRGFIPVTVEPIEDKA